MVCLYLSRWWKGCARARPRAREGLFLVVDVLFDFALAVHATRLKEQFVLIAVDVLVGAGGCGGCGGCFHAIILEPIMSNNN